LIPELVDEDALRSRLAATLGAVGAGAASAGIATDVTVRYGEAHRAYHTLRHVAECLKWFDETRGLAREAEAVELAIWFHDVVYDPKQPDNERRSGEFAAKALVSGGVDGALAERVRLLVLATAHDDAERAGDAALLCDIDLSILGSSHWRFVEYEGQVRREYAHVTDDEFRAGRLRVVRAFAVSDRIYRTEYFADRLEIDARLNIGRSIRRLGG